MNEKENKQLSNKTAETIEDLTINQSDAEEVKGGPIYMHIEGIKGSVTQAGSNPYVTTDYVERASN